MTKVTTIKTTRSSGYRKRSTGKHTVARAPVPLEERLARIEEKLDTVIEMLQKLLEGGEVKPRRSTKRTAADIVKEQGIVFESDLGRRIRDKDKFFESLLRAGIRVIAGTRERVAVSESFFENFKKALSRCRGPAEAEEKLTEKYFRFYKFLRDAGLLIYTKRGWAFNF